MPSKKMQKKWAEVLNMVEWLLDCFMYLLITPSWQKSQFT